MKAFVSNRVSIAPASYVQSVSENIVHFNHPYSFYKLICSIAEYEEIGVLSENGKSINQSITIKFPATDEQKTKLSNHCVIKLLSDSDKTIIVGSPYIPATPISIKNIGNEIIATYVCVSTEFQL